MIEQSNEIVRRINRQAGREVLPEARALVSSVGRLPGIDGRAKMSKSAGNAIPLSASPEEISRGIVPAWCVAVSASRRRQYPGGEFFLPCVLVIKRLTEGERHDKAQLNDVLRTHGVST